MTKDEINKLFEYKDGGLYWKVDNPQGPVGTRAGKDCGLRGREIGFNKKVHKEHRLVFILHHGFIPKFIEHVNGNKKDNRIENLQACSRQPNGWNSIGSMARKSLKWRGVYRKGVQWEASISHEGQRISLGVFDDEKEAASTYNIAAKKYYSDQAVLNKLD